MLLLLSAVALAGTCASYGAFALRCTLSDSPDLSESSGLAVSRTRDVLYTHEDSGGAAEIYAFQADGTPRGAHAVNGAFFIDWEDLALGPCPDDSSSDCLYIADIGDNFRIRGFVVVYAAREPTGDGQPIDVVAKWTVTYPEGAQDAEAILVHPWTGAVFLVTKESAADSRVYRLPWAPSGDEPTPMTLVAEVPIPLPEGGGHMVTGGAYDVDADRVLLRTYSDVLVWDADPCDPDATWAGEPTLLPTVDESQGEAVALDPATGDVLTTSEGSPMTLSGFSCEGFTQVPRECPEVDTGDTADTGGQGVTPAPTAEEDGCGCGGGRAGLLLPGLLVGLGLRRRGREARREVLACTGLAGRRRGA